MEQNESDEGAQGALWSRMRVTQRGPGSIMEQNESD